VYIQRLRVRESACVSVCVRRWVSGRFCLQPKNSNFHGFELHRPSIKGTKLLLKVMKAIIIIIRLRGGVASRRKPREQAEFNRESCYGRKNRSNLRLWAERIWSWTDRDTRYCERGRGSGLRQDSSTLDTKGCAWISSTGRCNKKKSMFLGKVLEKNFAGPNSWQWRGSGIILVWLRCICFVLCVCIHIHIYSSFSSYWRTGPWLRRVTVHAVGQLEHLSSWCLVLTIHADGWLQHGIYQYTWLYR